MNQYERLIQISEWSIMFNYCPYIYRVRFGLKTLKIFAGSRDSERGLGLHGLYVLNGCGVVLLC